MSINPCWLTLRFTSSLIHHRRIAAHTITTVNWRPTAMNGKSLSSNATEGWFLTPKLWGAPPPKMWMSVAKSRLQWNVSVLHWVLKSLWKKANKSVNTCDILQILELKAFRTISLHLPLSIKITHISPYPFKMAFRKCTHKQTLKIFKICQAENTWNTWDLLLH